MSEFDEIVSAIGEEAALIQLAEEASELSQAACKLARYLHGTNPVSRNLDDKKLRDMLVEEFSDTCLAAHVCGINVDNDLIDKKTKRWLGRIKENECYLGPVPIPGPLPTWIKDCIYSKSVIR